MRLSTQHSQTSRDGELLVVHSDGRHGAKLGGAFPHTLLSALEHWDEVLPKLKNVSDNLEKGRHGEIAELNNLRAPLPRTWSWVDGSAFLEHVRLVRKARKAELPEDLFDVPLMYQGMSDNLLGPNDDIPFGDDQYGCDFEGEVAIILRDVPQGTVAAHAEQYIALFVLMNDVSLRKLIPRELKTGFGFFHGKPASSFSPFAITPDELGSAWKDGRVHLDLECRINGQLVGSPNAGEMHFSFPQLIEHAAKTRPLSAGTILGSGTVSNSDASRGVSCLVERRVREELDCGKSVTPFLKNSDVVEIEMKKDGRSLFGTIRNRIVSPR